MQMLACRRPIACRLSWPFRAFFSRRIIHCERHKLEPPQENRHALHNTTALKAKSHTTCQKNNTVNSSLLTLSAPKRIRDTTKHCWERWFVANLALNFLQICDAFTNMHCNTKHHGLHMKLPKDTCAGAVTWVAQHAAVLEVYTYREQRPI